MAGSGICSAKCAHGWTWLGLRATPAASPSPLTQTDLGDAVGLSIVHVNRTLQRMRAEGLISWQRDHVTVPAPQALEIAVGFDGSYLKLGSAALPNLPFPKPE
jgi:predicted transcriptional regulator